MSLSVLYRFYTKFVLLFRDSAVSIQQLRVVCSHFRSVQTPPLLKNRRKRKMSVSHRPISDFFLREVASVHSLCLLSLREGHVACRNFTL